MKYVRKLQNKIISGLDGYLVSFCISHVSSSHPANTSPGPGTTVQVQHCSSFLFYSYEVESEKEK